MLWMCHTNAVSIYAGVLNDLKNANTYRLQTLNELVCADFDAILNLWDLHFNSTGVRSNETGNAIVVNIRGARARTHAPTFVWVYQWI